MRSVIPALRIASFSALALLYVGCHGDGPTQPGSHFTGVRATLGANATDTVLALQAQALVVEVRDSNGQVVKGVTVRFEALPPTDSTRRYESAINVCALTAPTCGVSNSSPFSTDVTDDQGHAKAMVRLGTVAGKAMVRLLVPELAFSDTVSFTVTPGSAAHVRAIAPDTGLDVGTTAMLRGRVTDRFYNARPDLPTMSLGAGSAATIDPATAVVTAREMGTQWLYARFGSFVDSMSVRVVPPGRLVVWSSLSRQVRLVNLNGAAVVTLASSVASDYGAFPRFDAARQHVAMHTGSQAYGGPATDIAVVDTGSMARWNLLGTSSGFTTIFCTRQLADGSLLVVGQRGSGTAVSLWRVASDGTLTTAAGLPGILSMYGGADISSDGSKVVYTITGTNGGTQLRLLDVASGTTTDLPMVARSPRLSPDGNRVAYLTPGGYNGVDGTPAVINTDGTNNTALSSLTLSPGIAWSPDGAYLLGRNSDYGTGTGLRLIRISDRATVMLRFHGSNGSYEDYFQPDWR